ncbi:glycosyltransferase family 2 protein [Candidatus Poriferisodalis sp.]|uniref:glycosyltransferase family 2 protein n=1 Tax=Candidatus Poriferisodalis sp. TaxID=3101277 RepID=UPI003B02192C
MNAPATGVALHVAARRPPVSVVIPARDCAAQLGECLEAVNAQIYTGKLDVLVAVAPSSDDTALCARNARCAWPLQVVENPAGTTSSGLNLAIGAATGEVIVRVDAQARLPPDYVERAVAAMERTGAANVGGVQRPVGGCKVSRIIAAALASPFGGGPAAFRRGRTEGPVDTVYLGVFDAAALACVGGFDESLERNQDYELNWRLREQGLLVWLDPSLVVDYQPRSSWAGLARQYFDYGAAKRVVISRHPRSTRPRQLVAPALAIGLALSAVELARGRRRGGIVPVVYLGACTLAASRLRSKLPAWSDRVRATAAFAVMHLAWGAGMLCGRPRWHRKRTGRASRRHRGAGR